MGEVIFLHTGQAGVQMGENIWELFRHEHKINSDGRISEEDYQGAANNSYFKIFQEVGDKKFVPRSIFMDLDPVSINRVWAGESRDLFASENLLSANEDASNNFAKGFYTNGKDMKDLIMKQIRHNVE